jgi:hypothetical protein
MQRCIEGKICIKLIKNELFTRGERMRDTQRDNACLLAKNSEKKTESECVRRIEEIGEAWSQLTVAAVLDHSVRCPCP